MSERKRPKYTKEFKQDAIKLVIEQRYSCPEVGRRLGVAASNISRWVREYRQDQQDLSENGITRKDLEAENRRLKQENKRLEMEREILKKANDRGSVKSLFYLFSPNHFFLPAPDPPFIIICTTPWTFQEAGFCRCGNSINE